MRLGDTDDRPAADPGGEGGDEGGPDFGGDGDPADPGGGGERNSADGDPILHDLPEVLLVPELQIQGVLR